MISLSISSVFNWRFTHNWRQYVDLAKRFACRFDPDKKYWVIPNFPTSVEMVRELLKTHNANELSVRDFDSGRTVDASQYVSNGYLRMRSGIGTRLPFGLTIEGKDAYVSMPLADDGTPGPEHSLAYGLAKDGCNGLWKRDKGFHLRANVREAVDYFVNHSGGACPVLRGLPSLYETPFIVDTYSEILDHQRAGVSFLYHRRAALLADDMGLGKTMQAIIAAEALRIEGRALGLLVLCPVSLVGNWRKELKRWDTGFSEVTIVPYSQLKLLKDICAGFIGGQGLVVIADEAHYLKNVSSQRTQAVTRFVLNNPKLAALWFLTGTPVTRDFSNLWAIADLMKHPVADLYRPSMMMKLSNEAILKLSGAMRTHMLVRKKSDCLNLPAKIRQFKQIDTGLENLVTIRDLEILATGKDEAAMEHLMTMKRLTAEAKVPETIEMAKQLLAEGRKVVLFTDHTKAFDAFVSALGNYGVVSIDGRTPAKWRTTVVEGFQTDMSVRVFVGNIKAAGVGITLTASQDVIFNDFTWLPADIHQAEDRVHRIGTVGTVNIFYVADTNLILDQLLCERLAERSAEIASFEGSQQSILTEIRAWARGELAQKKLVAI